MARRSASWRTCRSTFWCTLESDRTSVASAKSASRPPATSRHVLFYSLFKLARLYLIVDCSLFTACTRIHRILYLLLQTHMRLHSGEKPFACKLCPAKFTQFVHLKLHRRLHTNDRPFEVLRLFFSELRNGFILSHI